MAWLNPSPRGAGTDYGNIQGHSAHGMSDTRAGNGKVVANGSLSLDGFIAGPGNVQDWILGFVEDDAPWQKEAAVATADLLVG
jgi:hypothetical protein